MKPTFSNNPHTHFSGKNCGTTFGNDQTVAQPQVAFGNPVQGQVAFGNSKSLVGPEHGDMVSFSGCCK